MRVLAVCGSLRKQSFNLALLRAAAELAPAGMEIVIYPLDGLPHYNGDDDPKDPSGAPASVREFRQAVAESDGFMAAIPEFSHSYPGVLKNAIDWLAHADVLENKPATAVSAAPNQGGGVRGQLALREVYFAVGADLFVNYELLVRHANQKFDAAGKLIDEPTRKQYAEFLAAFAEHIRRTKAAVSTTAGR